MQELSYLIMTEGDFHTARRESVTNRGELFLQVKGVVKLLLTEYTHPLSH